MNKAQLQELLESIENAPVECDGFVRLASFLLHEKGVQYQIYRGRLKCDAGVIPLHFWISTGDFIIDYRAQMWLGDKAPHGVFEASRLRNATYTGETQTLEPIGRGMFEILCMPINFPT